MIELFRFKLYFGKFIGIGFVELFLGSITVNKMSFVHLLLVFDKNHYSFGDPRFYMESF